MYRAVLWGAATLLGAAITAVPAAADDGVLCRLKTLEACSRLIEHSPNDADARYQRGWLYIHQRGDFDRAIADFDQAIRISPNNGDYYKERAAAYGRKGDHDREIADYGQVIRIYPGAAPGYVSRGQGFLQKGDYDHAIADFDRAMQLGPKTVSLFTWRAVAFARKGDDDRAIADYDEAIRLAPDAAEGYSNRAIAFYKKGDYDRAFADYDQAVRLKPSPGTYATRGGAWSGRGDYDRALADYDQALRLDPAFDPAYAGRADVAILRGDYDRAIADLNEAIRLDPIPASYFARRGAALSFRGDYDRAMPDLDQAVRYDPKLAFAWSSRGLAWNGKGDYDRAIADFDEAVRLAPEYANAYSHRGVAWAHKGDFDRAMADLDKAIALTPRYARGYGNRAAVHLLRGDRDRARADYETALKLDPHIANVADMQPLHAAFAPRPAPPPADQAITGARVALVIGNSRYAFAPALPNPRRDAEAVAAALRQDGFQVIVATDLGRDAMRDALRSFRSAADKAEWGLVYYAGHGLQTGGTNHLVPIDAHLRDERDVAGETISYAEVEAAAGGARTLRIIILDACRADPFAATMARANPVRALPRGLSAPPEPEPGLLVAYAARDGQTAEDGDGDISPFAVALVKQLRVPGREVRRLFDFVRDDVVRATRGRQQPFTYGSLPAERDFFFVAAQ